MLCDALSWFFLGTGAIVLVIASLGVVRLPDYYSRIHAASVTDTLGAGLIAVGLALQVPLGITTTGKLVMIVLFLVLTGPATTHALARAAKAHSLDLPPVLNEGLPDDGKENG